MSRPLARLAAGALLGLASLAGLSWSPTADAKFVFPYNHPDLDWYSIETEHFVVHYPVSKKTADEGNEHYLTGEWSARKIAQVSEDMWEPMCAEFNYYLKEKVHVVLLNQSDQLEGFTIPSWDWIEISANPGGTFYRSRGRMEWFSDVMVHEFAHVVSLKANAAHSEGIQGVSLDGLYRDGIRDVEIGASMFIFDGDSVFWTEGGAEYWSDNTGWNWWTAARDQNIRMTVLQDRLLEYDEWHTRSAKYGWNDSERYYQQGYSFGLYLRQRFGADTYARFALEFGKAWRPNWETVIEDVLGIDAETLYWDWRAYVTERYEDQADRVRARGEVSGLELTSGQNDWEFNDPAARDAWLSDPLLDREDARQGGKLYQFDPRVSPNGDMWGINNRARVYFNAEDDDQMFAFTRDGNADAGRSEAASLMSGNRIAKFGHGWDFVPSEDGETRAIVVTGEEDRKYRGVPPLHRYFHLEADGYDWQEIVYFELPTREDKQGNRTVETRSGEKVLGSTTYPEESWRVVPNTQRGTDPAVSPDGSKIAYFEYTDGTLNLVTINLDGSDKNYLTNYTDGTWLQTVDWSPDGTQLVLGIFKNFEQNLFVVNADGSDLHPITWDQWEEMDAHWSADGHIYFSAEPDGIFNIYRYDPTDASVEQVTNVLGGATTPQVTDDGNLIYSYATAFGWKVHGLRGEEFMAAPADHLFRTGDEIDGEQVESALAFEEDLSHWSETTTRYRPSKAVMAPTGVPLFDVRNNSMTNWGIRGGFQVFMQDYVEKNGAFMVALLGEDPLFQAQYFNQTWYPDFFVTGVHLQQKRDFGFLIDEDGDRATTDDQSILEQRNHTYQTFGAAAAAYQWNDVMRATLSSSLIDFGFKGIADTGFDRYLIETDVNLGLSWSDISLWGANTANPLGRYVDLQLTHAWTDIVFESYGGVGIDDGMLLDNYQYNKLELRWNENLPVPFIKKAQAADHRIQLDFRFGYIDRNVDVNDEFRAGGQHPSFTGNGNLRPNTQFPGYPAFSLSGETMGIFNLQYRFPINDHFVHRVGPLTTYGVFAQLGGSAGNLWSYRPPSDPASFYLGRFGDRVAYEESDVRREVPFVDYAYKNDNYILYDVSAELRVQSVLFHGIPWNSFARLAYGFNAVRGYGDVDGDDIFDTSENGLGDELSNEKEPAGFRLYVGLGTGW